MSQIEGFTFKNIQYYELIKYRVMEFFLNNIAPFIYATSK